MSTKKTPQTKQTNKAKTPKGTDSADPAKASEIASVETPHSATSIPLGEIPDYLLFCFFERKMHEGGYGFAPKSLLDRLHEIPRSMWPNPSPMELAKLVAECGWAGNSCGAMRAMDLLWQSSYAKHTSLASVERWVKMVESEAPNEASKLAADMDSDFTKLPDSISRAQFMAFFNTDPLTFNGKRIRGDDLFDYWIQLPDTMNLLSGYGLSHIKDNLPNFHAKMKRHGAKIEDWSGGFAPHVNDWLKLCFIVSDFKAWRKKTAEENKATGKGNLRMGDKSPDTTTPLVDTAPAGKTNQVKRTRNNRKGGQGKEITPTQDKKMSKALDAALNDHNLGGRGTGKQKRPR